MSCLENCQTSDCILECEPVSCSFRMEGMVRKCDMIPNPRPSLECMDKVEGSTCVNSLTDDKLKQMFDASTAAVNVNTCDMMTSRYGIAKTDEMCSSMDTMCASKPKNQCIGACVLNDKDECLMDPAAKAQIMDSCCKKSSDPAEQLIRDPMDCALVDNMLMPHCGGSHM